MLSAFYNYLHCKLFPKAVIGGKRRFEECNESPPNKVLKVDGKNIFDIPETSIDYNNIMESKRNYHNEDDGCYIVGEVQNKKYGVLPSMARKSIRKSQCGGSEVTVIKSTNHRKSGIEASERGVEAAAYTCNSDKDVEVVKYVTNSNFKKALVDTKNKNVAHRIFTTSRVSSQNTSNSSRRSGTSFQNNMKKRLNFLRESYRLAEKYQYSQLLQSFTNRPAALFNPSVPKPLCQRVSKASIPLIDLTKEKSNVCINRSRENIPWTSTTELNDCTSEGSQSTKKNDVPRVNSFQEYIKTNPVTEEDVVEQIDFKMFRPTYHLLDIISDWTVITTLRGLSHHTKVSNEKRKQAALETAKLEVLSDCNRKAYGDVLEERLRTYMRITSPVVVEVELEEEEKYKLPTFTPEQETKINKALVPSPESQILAEKFGLQIKRRDMQTLKGLGWLNDEVINFYMNLIMERGKESGLPKVYAFNTFFYPKLIASGHASLKRWTKKVDIFSYDMVLVPVHLGVHWCMSLIDFRYKEVRYYDSMGSCNDTCLQALLTYLEDESLDKKKTTYSTDDWKQMNVEDIPQQMNGSDCGVFSCTFAEHLARDAPILFSQDNMPYFRRKMVLEILEGKLLT